MHHIYFITMTEPHQELIKINKTLESQYVFAVYFSPFECSSRLICNDWWVNWCLYFSRCTESLLPMITVHYLKFDSLLWALTWENLPSFHHLKVSHLYSTILSNFSTKAASGLVNFESILFKITRMKRNISWGMETVSH